MNDLKRRNKLLYKNDGTVRGLSMFRAQTLNKLSTHPFLQKSMMTAYGISKEKKTNYWELKA